MRGGRGGDASAWSLLAHDTAAKQLILVVHVLLGGLPGGKSNRRHLPGVHGKKFSPRRDFVSSLERAGGDL